jgi:hypothetical protein
MCLVLASVAKVGTAAPNLQLCQMLASLAKNIAEDRDRGVAYKAELGKLKGAMEDEPQMKPIYTIATGLAKIVYKQYPALTPDGAYKLEYQSCMSQK